MDIQLEKQKIINSLQNPKPADIDKMSYQYAIFVANAKNFLPELSKDKYRSFFTNLIYQKWLSGVEQYDPKLLKKMKVINSTSFNLEDPEQCPPLIFATFHSGPYRMFNLYLLECGFKVVLIVDDMVYLTQKNEMFDCVKNILKKNEKADLIILNVKDRASIFKLKNLILDGYVMSVYVDGNTGIGKAQGNEFDNSFTPIIFFNNTVYVKNGIGKLSLLVNADIIPVISYRDENENPIIQFSKEINFSEFGDKKIYPTKSIEYVYKVFEDSLKIHKAQWLDWLRIHKWFKRESKTPYTTNPNPNINYIFNEDRYSLFTVAGDYYLFDLYDYKSFPISSELYAKLINNKISLISEDITIELIQKNVIV